MEVNGNDQTGPTEDFFFDGDVTDFGSQGTVIEEDYLNQGGSPATSEEVAPVEKSKEKKVKKEESFVKLPTDDYLAEADDTEDEEEETTTEEVTKEIPEATAETVAEEESENEENTEDTEDTNVFGELSKSLIEYGIFTQIEGEEETPVTSPEEFKERWEKEKQMQVNSGIKNFILSKHGQEGLDVFNSIFVQGAAPKDYLSRYTQLESLAEIDLESEANQEHIYKMYHKSIGWSDDRINKKLERDKSYGDLAEDVKGYHEMLLEKEQAQLERMAEEAEIRQQQADQYEAMYSQKIAEIIGEKSKTRDFDGIPVTEKVAKDTFSYLVDKKFRIPSTGEMLTTFDKDILELRKPENYELKIKLALLLRNGFDLTKIQAKAVSQTKGKLFDNVARQSKKVPKAPKQTQEQQDSFWNKL